MSFRGRGANHQNTVSTRAGPGGAGAGEVPGRLDTTINMDSQDSTDNCGLCGQQTGDDSIGCDVCGTWFHPTTNCTGLSVNAINVINTEGGEALAFKCSSCLCNAPNTSRSSNSCSGIAIKQVFEIVKALSCSMAQLTQNVQLLTQQVCEKNSGPSNQSPSVPQANSSFVERKDLYNEMYEFEERKKRTKSIVIRGIRASNNKAFGTAFGEVCNFLMPSTPTPSGEIFCIDREKSLYRVNLND